MNRPVLTLAKIVTSACCLLDVGFAQTTGLTDPADASRYAVQVVNGGYVGFGISTPLGRVHISDGTQMSGHNYGANLVLSGNRNPSLVLLNSQSSEPWAIVNHGGNLEFASMPPLGDITSSPDTLLSMRRDGTVSIPGPTELGPTRVHGGDVVVDGSRGFQSSSGPLFVMGHGGLYLNAFEGNGDVYVGGWYGSKGNLNVNGNVTVVSLSLTCDQNAKQNFKDVDSEDVLDRVLKMPIYTWAYKESPQITHMNTTSQVFRKLFPELGEDDTHIAAVDMGGVTLAAVQGLAKKIERLEQENATLKASMASLMARLEALERAGK